ncbi:MAG: hypothetical protein ABNH00_08495 [Dokdonia sp.]|jgi:Na+/proline symporter|nr:hypothetical protein [Cytophagaceae bacterium]
MWPEWISLLRLSADAGLVVLIWMVQGIIYPSFRYFSSDVLQEWHHRYTRWIGGIVMPLMLIQLGLILSQLWWVKNGYTISSLILLILVWLSTFIQFVPRHQKIANNQATKALLNQLVKLNWIRTIIWTAMFIITLTYLLAFAK